MARRPRLPTDDGNGDGAYQRRCIVSGVVKSKDELLRFVIGPDGQVVPDIEGRLPGRGFWLSARRDVLEKACAKNLFAKAARKDVIVGAGLTDQVERLLTRRCLDLIGLARRAGQAVSGHDRAQEWVKGGRCGVLLAAADGAPGGRAKMRAVATGMPVVEVLSGAELGSATGRERAVHLVVAPGKLAAGLLREAARLAGFRAAPSGDAGTEEK
jgi:predicted RNA-binding protein YlxR (DUF448 family)